MRHVWILALALAAVACDGGRRERTVCTPDCGGRACGPDPVCGRSCGTCDAPTSCDVAAGTCTGTCQPDCGARVCGLDPQCASSCGTCALGTCTPDGVCEVPCVPDCAGRSCGPDPVCGESCGNCDAGQTCTTGGLCESCTPDCTGLKCGPDPTCGASCGTCAAGRTCRGDGVCVDMCTPDCTGRECGPDGCGGDCGSCNAPLSCDAGTCVLVCGPGEMDCGGPECTPTEANPMHCGACNNLCPPASVYCGTVGICAQGGTTSECEASDCFVFVGSTRLERCEETCNRAGLRCDASNTWDISLQGCPDANGAPAMPNAANNGLGSGIGCTHYANANGQQLLFGWDQFHCGTRPEEFESGYGFEAQWCHCRVP